MSLLPGPPCSLSQAGLILSFLTGLAAQRPFVSSRPTTRPCIRLQLPLTGVYDPSWPLHVMILRRIRLIRRQRPRYHHSPLRPPPPPAPLPPSKTRPSRT